MQLSTTWRHEDGADLASTVWRAGPGHRMISSALLGGGFVGAEWVLNAQVAGGYSRMDPVTHLHELAASRDLSGAGVGMLTAAAVDRTIIRLVEGVTASATVGLRIPTWAAVAPGTADPELAPERWRPGTINLTVSVPVALSDAAMVNAVITATEAKTQALLEAGYPCTGTASDAICVAAPTAGAEEPFAGPRSEWGARLARAVHAAVLVGARDYTAQLTDR